MSPGRPPTSLGEEHDREPPLLCELEHPVFLAVVLPALGTGEDGVVVGHHDATGSGFAEEIAVHAADSSQHAVGGRVGDQIFDAPASALRGDHERAVFADRAGVTQVFDVLTHRALTGLAPARHGLGAGGVQPRFVSRVHLR